MSQTSAMLETTKNAIPAHRFTTTAIDKLATVELQKIRNICLNK